MLISTYTPGLSPPTLNGSEVHVWCFGLQVISEHSQRFRSILSDDEHHRASRFHFDKDASRYICSRGLLRELLAGYLNRIPKAIDLEYGDYGKPKLHEESPHLQFNVSHSKDLVAYAFSHNHSVGIDVETAREISDVDLLAKRCLSADQFAAFKELNPSEKFRAFYRFWTRKEALIKATGLGLSQGLRSFDVTFLDGEPAQLMRASNGFDDVRDWRLVDLQVSPKDFAAIAIRGRDCKIKLVDTHTNHS